MKKLIILVFAIIFGMQALGQENVITTTFQRGEYIVKEYSLKAPLFVNPKMWKDSVLISASLTDQSDEKKIYLEMLINSGSLRWQILATSKPQYSDLLPVYSNQIDYLIRQESCALNTPKTKWGFSKADLNKLIGDAFTDMTWTYYMLYSYNGKTDVDRESVLYYANKALAYDSTNYQAWTYLARVYYQEIEWESIYGLTLLLKDNNPERKVAREAGLSKAEIIIEKTKLFSNVLEKAEKYGMPQDEQWTKSLLEEGKNNLEHFNGLIESLKEMVEK